MRSVGSREVAVAGCLAEGVGFEPTRACALPVFKTGAINRSTTPPLNSDLCRRAGDNTSASGEGAANLP